MKQQILILFLGLALFTGCEKSVQNSSNELTDPDLQNLSSDLISDLNLSKSSADELNQSLNRHYGKGKHHPPGFLWNVAADLQQSLSDEEKAAIFDRLDQHNQDLFLYRFRAQHFTQNHRGMLQHELQVIRSVLTEDQQEAFNAILESYKEKFIALRDSLQSGSITRETFHSEMGVLRDAMLAEIDALLTEEQKATLEDKKAQFEANREQWRQHRQEQREKIKQAMYEALEFTESQITAYEQIQVDSKTAIQNLRDQLKNGGIVFSDFRDSLQVLISDRNTQIEAMLTVKQLEIVKIHLFLEIRLMLWRHRMLQPLRNFGYNAFQQFSELKIEMV
jgi:hypothetical protein